MKKKHFMTTLLSLIKTITATIISVSDDASCNKMLVPVDHLDCCTYTSIFMYATYHLMSLDKCYVN